MNPRAASLAYSAILFSGNPLVGAALIVATLFEPWQGLSGLAGTAIALFGARAIGFDQRAADDGRLLFNSMLTALALAHWLPPGAVAPLAYVMLLITVSLAALGASVLINHRSIVLNGIPAMSLPFCAVATCLHWFIGQSTLPGATAPATDFLQLSGVAEQWSRSLGSIFFVSRSDAGVLVTLVLLVASRLSFLNAIIGFFVSRAILTFVGFPEDHASWIQLNAILCAMAAGGVFFIPSRSALVLAAAGAALCVFVGVGMTRILLLADIPVLTLPFNIATLGIVAAMRWRTANSRPRAAVCPGKSPEDSFRSARIADLRFPGSELPAIALPFDGEWVVTQGFDGEITHRSLWRHALDFEVASWNHRVEHPKSTELSDFPSFGAPVVSPADGRIVRVIDDVADNPIGKSNLPENWGNSVVVETAPGLYAQLSHFRRHSINVREGDRVRQGQLLGYLGNSGRSPVPHLHLQMQASPEVGAATIPFRLRGYRALGGDGEWAWQFRGLPAEGDALAGCRRARWLEEEILALFTGGGERVFRVLHSGSETQETLRYSMDADTSLLLHSGRSFMRLCLHEQCLVPFEIGGPPSRIFSLLWMAGRIPLCPIAGTRWTDVADTAAPDAGVRRFLQDITDPYIPRRASVQTGEIITCDAKTRQFGIRASLPGSRTVEVFLGGGLPFYGRLETRTGWMCVMPLEDAFQKAFSPPLEAALC